MKRVDYKLFVSKYENKIKPGKVSLCTFCFCYVNVKLYYASSMQLVSK